METTVFLFGIVIHLPWWIAKSGILQWVDLAASPPSNISGSYQLTPMKSVEHQLVQYFDLLCEESLLEQYSSTMDDHNS